MKILKLLSKNYFLVILFSLFFGFATNSQEPVDIWEVGEKKPEENTTIIEDETEKNILQNSIYKMQSQKEEVLSIQETQTLISKEIKLVGIYDPAENGLDINMWSNSNGDQILNIFKRNSDENETPIKDEDKGTRELEKEIKKLEREVKKDKAKSSKKEKKESKRLKKEKEKKEKKKKNKEDKNLTII